MASAIEDRLMCCSLYRTQQKKCNYLIDNAQLNMGRLHNDLGVTVNEILLWSEHSLQVCNRASPLFNMYKRAFGALFPHVMCRLYITYMRSLLEYASVVWFQVLRRDANLLDRTQWRATRLAYGRHRPSYEECCTLLNIDPFTNGKVVADL